jgi:hypothetical protein
MSFLPVLLAVGGGLMSAGASAAAGEAERNAAYYNARVSEQRAASERDAAAAEAQDQERRGSAAIGSNLAAAGGSGVTSERSPLLVNTATVREIALGVQRTLHGGERRAVGLENQAKLYRYGGDEARAAGYMKAGGTLLATGYKAGAAAGMW